MDLSPLVQIFERLSNDVKIELAHTFPIGQRECPKTIQTCISLLKRAKKCGLYSSDEKLIRSFLHKNDALYLESHLSNDQKINLDQFLTWFSSLAYHSTRSRKPNYFLKKAFKESTQKASEGCQTLWLRLVSDFKEAYEKNELDEVDKEKVCEVFMRALSSDYVRRKLKAQYHMLNFEWNKPMSFARQARLFEEEEKALMINNDTNEILTYLKDKLKCTKCRSFDHHCEECRASVKSRAKSLARDRERSLSPDRSPNGNRDRPYNETYSRDREKERNLDYYRNDRSYNRFRNDGHSYRYRDNSRYRNDEIYDDRKDRDRDNYSRDRSLSRDRDHPDFQGN